MPIPRLDVPVSAGPGRLVEAEGGATLGLDPALLRALGVRPEAASLVRVEGESMAPDLRDGDEVLVDADRRRPDARGAVYVLRLDGAVMVKRVATEGEGWRVTSDNPDAPSPGLVPVTRADIVGRIVWLRG